MIKKTTVIFSLYGEGLREEFDDDDDTLHTFFASFNRL